MVLLHKVVTDHITVLAPLLKVYGVLILTAVPLIEAVKLVVSVKGANALKVRSKSEQFCMFIL